MPETSRDYLDTTEKLLSFIEEARESSVLAVDTEFIRERTFFPQLCLLQLATPQRSVIVDPLALTDLSPLIELFTAENIVKVFHAATQDIEIIYLTLSVVPYPLFDTQVAAEFLGLPQQTSLRNLVQEFVGVRLNKTDSLTNWSSRPLTNSQIDYALDDVRFLPDIHNKMVEQLEARGRLSWLNDDHNALADESNYRLMPGQAWHKIKHSSGLRTRQLSVLRELAKTRDSIAMRKNLPRKWILTDELIVEIARLCPQTLEELFHLRGAESQLGKNWGKDVLEAVQRGLEAEPDQRVQKKRSEMRFSSNPAAADMMRVLINQRAREHEVTTAMLINKNELIQLSAGEREGLKILTGWRYEIVGKELIQLLEGKLNLRLNDTTVEVTPLEEE